jgi:hypothetical protein
MPVSSSPSGKAATSTTTSTPPPDPGYREAVADAQTEGKRVMRIVVTSVLMDDQEKALLFYTDVLGFFKKNDILMESPRAAIFGSPCPGIVPARG